MVHVVVVGGPGGRLGTGSTPRPIDKDTLVELEASNWDKPVWWQRPPFVRVSPNTNKSYMCKQYTDMDFYARDFDGISAGMLKAALDLAFLSAPLASSTPTLPRATQDDEASGQAAFTGAGLLCRPQPRSLDAPTARTAAALALGMAQGARLRRVRRAPRPARPSAASGSACAAERACSWVIYTACDGFSHNGLAFTTRLCSSQLQTDSGLYGGVSV